MSHSRAVFSNMLVLVLAAIAALASGAVQREGPDHGIYCNLEKSNEGFYIYCPKPKLNGGWPAPFIFDRSGITMEGSLFIEDDFRLAPFSASAGFYLLLIIAIRRIVRSALLRRNRRRARRASGTV